MKLKNLMITALICLSGLGIGCGSGSQTTNGIVSRTPTNRVTVLSAHNMIIVTGDSGMNITLLNSHYIPYQTINDPDTSVRLITMRDTFYIFDSLAAGNYTITAKNNDGKAAIFQAIPVDDSHDITENDSLRSTGSIRGTVTYAEDQAVISGFVYIEGTQFRSFTDQGGNFLIDSVPVNTYKLSFIDETNDSDTIPEGRNANQDIVISPDDLDIQTLIIIGR